MLFIFRQLFCEIFYISNFDLSGSYIPRKARSDIVAYATVILLTLFAVVLDSPVKSTREAHNTRHKPNITAKQYHSPLGEYNCGAMHR